MDYIMERSSWWLIHTTVTTMNSFIDVDSIPNHSQGIQRSVGRYRQVDVAQFNQDIIDSDATEASGGVFLVDPPTGGLYFNE
jgi:hypothetical protein